MTEVLSRLLSMSGEQRAALVAGLHDTVGVDDADESTGAGGSAVAEASPTRAPTGPPAASFGQEQLWILDQLQPGSARYNVPFEFEITGWVDESLLIAALRDVATRHPALRTALALHVDDVVQVVRDDVAADIVTYDLRNEIDPVARAHALARDFAGRPFDLTDSPLWRAMLLRIGPEHRKLVWIASHAVADGWSIGVLAAELSACYAARTRPGASARPTPVPFVEFSRWQRERSVHWDDELGYWAGRLAHRAPLSLAPGRRGTGVGATVIRRVPEATVASIAALAAAHQTTPFTVWLTANHLMLGGITGRDDVSAGTVVAGRSPRFEGTIGSFVNTLVIAADTTAPQLAADFTATVRAALLGALDHAEVPFGKVVEALAPGREGATNPLCRTVFTYGSTASSSRATFLGSAVVEPCGISNGTARFDLELAVEQLRSTTRLRIEYDTGVLSAAEAERVADAYLAVVALLTRPGITVGACRAAAVGVLDSPVEPAADASAPVEPQPGGAAEPVDKVLIGTVTDVWAEHLGDLTFGPDDDFFGLGGHSMMATRIVAELRRRCGISLELVELFENPTVTGLAALIQARRHDALALLVDGMSDEEVQLQLAELDGC